MIKMQALESDDPLLENLARHTSYANVLPPFSHPQSEHNDTYIAFHLRMELDTVRLLIISFV